MTREVFDRWRSYNFGKVRYALEKQRKAHEDLEQVAKELGQSLVKKVDEAEITLNWFLSKQKVFYAWKEIKRQKGICNSVEGNY